MLAQLNSDYIYLVTIYHTGASWPTAVWRERDSLPGWINVPKQLREVIYFVSNYGRNVCSIISGLRCCSVGFEGLI